MDAVEAEPDPSEVIPPGEAAAVRRIVGVIEARVRAAAALEGRARRDAHPKAHGCVRAEFAVRDDVPGSLRAGVFAQARTYAALIRYSNGSASPQPDSVGDGRGMAIKLLGVEGSPSGTQDFVMVNHPVFFVRNAIDYVEFNEASPGWRFFLPGWNPLHFRLHELLVARAITRRVVRNVLDIRYWSMTPYRLGEAVCKFSARPVGGPSPFQGTELPDFLRDNLRLHLAQSGAAFEFLAQVRTGAMPVEDPTVEWDEAVAPFVPLARITIAAQAFDAPEQLTGCGGACTRRCRGCGMR